MDKIEDIIEVVLAVYPNTQATYLFGSYGTADEWPDSDVDIALLLPPAEAKEAGSLLLGELHLGLQSLLNKEVDLLNLRRVSMVLNLYIDAVETNIIRRYVCMVKSNVAKLSD